MISAFGVDHGGVVSKREKPPPKWHREKSEPSGGRYATGVLFPGIHGAVAGKPGHKLKAAGVQLGGNIAGGAVLGPPGAMIGAGGTTYYAHKKGWLKKQKVKKNFEIAKAAYPYARPASAKQKGAQAGFKVGRALRSKPALVGAGVGTAAVGGAGLMAHSGRKKKAELQTEM